MQNSWSNKCCTVLVWQVANVYLHKTHFNAIFHLLLRPWMQARREGGVEGVSYPGLRDVWGLRRRPEIHIKYKVCQNVPFWKKFKNFLPRGAPWKCLGPHENVSPGPAVALDGSVWMLVMVAVHRRCRCAILPRRSSLTWSINLVALWAPTQLKLPHTVNRD